MDCLRVMLDDTPWGLSPNADRQAAFANYGAPLALARAYFSVLGRDEVLAF